MALEDKTEQASQQHRQETRKKGQVAKSMEITSAFVLLAGLIAGRFFAPAILGQLASATAGFLGNLASFNGTYEGARALVAEATMISLKVLAPILGAIGVSALVANFAQVGFVFSLQPLNPDMTRIDPVKGFGRMFSTRALVELVKSIAKVCILGYVVWSFLENEKTTVLSLGTMDRTLAGQVAGNLIWSLCMRACTVLLIIACLDYIYQRITSEKGIRMTKHEVKEEYRRSEGDPHLKSLFKRRHRELATRRMMQDVPKADVIVTNPTHIAIALKYDPATMGAPIVLAKGQRLIAERIKEIAKEQIEKMAAMGYSPVCLCSPRIRLYFRRLVERMAPQLAVLSYGEITPGIQVESTGMVSIDNDSQAIRSE